MEISSKSKRIVWTVISLILLVGSITLRIYSKERHRKNLVRYAKERVAEMNVRNIEFIKNSYLRGYEGTTIGKMFDNYSYWVYVEEESQPATNWEQETTENGINLVIFHGVVEREPWGVLGDTLPYKSIVISFIIHGDRKGFEIGNILYAIHGEPETEEEVGNLQWHEYTRDWEELLTKIYNNQKLE